MTKDEVWEKIKNEPIELYNQSFLDVFLQVSDHISYKHFASLPESKKKLVNNFYSIIEDLLMNSKIKELVELSEFKKEFKLDSPFAVSTSLTHLLKLCYTYTKGNSLAVESLMKIINKSNLSYYDLLRLFHFFTGDYDQIKYLNVLKNHFSKLPDHAVVSLFTKKYEYHQDEIVFHFAKLLKDEIARINDRYILILLETILEKDYKKSFEEIVKYIDFSKLDGNQIVMLLLSYGRHVLYEQKMFILVELLGDNIKKLNMGEVEYLLNYENRKKENPNYPIEIYKKIIEKYYN